MRAARQVLFRAGRAFAALGMLLAGQWATLALWFTLAPPRPFREVLAGGLMVLTVAAIAGLVRRRWRVVVAYGACLMLVLVGWMAQTPSNARAWSDDVARIASGTVTGDTLEIRNVRNFLWRSESDFEPIWETRTYNLDRLSGVDLIVSYWAGEAIAHTIISFGFNDGRFLAFSIETRKEKTEAYSALAGFFRRFELAILAADERDVLGVRTNMRGEDVRLYRLRMRPERARALLLEYVAAANALAEAPEFYNSLTSNCTTQIFRMVRAVRPGLPLDYRVVLSGYLPQYVYALGALDTSVPFADLRDRSHIAGKAASTEPDFSTRIRVGIPSP